MKKLNLVMSPTSSPSAAPYYDSVFSPSSSYSTTATIHQSEHSKLPIDFSPPLIAMVVIVATAFLIVTYLRLISHHVITPSLRRLRHWRHRRRRRHTLSISAAGDISSPPFFDDNNNNNFHVFSPYGLDESVIKTIPLSIYSQKINKNLNNKKGLFECAVCLLEFEENDYVRTLPICSHAFHVDCIDIWLRSHANCPLCRNGIFRESSPFIPLMSSRIRPSFDDGILDGIHEISLSPEIEEAPVSDRFNDGPVLKRSYSFGFERNFPSERLIERGMMTSPWRYRRGRDKRPSPFGKPRVFSLRMKSPFFRRRSFFPLSESSSRYGYSRRTKSLTSPMFSRPSGLFSSSRMRCGDPEALLSPERFNRR